MPALVGPTAIYEALLALATEAERAAIIEGGDAARLSPLLKYGDGSRGRERARNAYRAIDDILERIISDPSLKVTALDPRSSPPVRVELDSDLLRTGHLRWMENTGDSQLQFDWGGDELVRFRSLRVEIAEDSSGKTALTMKRSPNLIDGERKDDTQRLSRMQQIISTQGVTPTKASQLVALELPDGIDEANLARRLRRKFNKRAEQ